MKGTTIMTNEIQKFYNNEFGELDVLQDGDKFWFPATECAKTLGYSNPYSAIQRHCIGDGLAKREGVSLTKNQHGVITRQKESVNYIDEGNLYRLIVRSKLPNARAFEKWVFDEVLPSIRKHGAYIMPELLEELQRNTEKNAELLKNLAEEQRQRMIAESSIRSLESAKAALEAKIDKDKPKLTYYDMILDNPDAVPVTLIAKDYGYGAVRFNQMLHEYGIQFRVGGTWELYQEYAGNGYTHGNVHYTKGNHAKMHTCWTQKGRLFLYDFLKEHNILPAIEVNA